MRRMDEIDAKLAKHFAWRFVVPGDDVRIAALLLAAQVATRGGPAAAADGDVERDRERERDAGSRGAVDDGELDRSRDRIRNGCRAVAEGVVAAWALADDDASGRVTKRLLARADRLGVTLVGMDAHPVESVRLLRLIVRHASKMTRRQYERAAFVAAALPLDHPELADLFVEAARAGARPLIDSILADEDWEPDVGDANALAARLADVIDDADIDASRTVAVDVLARIARPEVAAPVLRRALRLPGFSVRAHALHALATGTTCLVSEDDLVLVLRDLAANPPPDSLHNQEEESDERLMAEAVLASLAHVQPAEAEEALLDIIDAEHEVIWLDAGWATEALSVAFPDTAAAMVDHWLKCARSHERMRALAAIERLPGALAEPRLRLAASDPALAVRENARRQWLQRFGRVCPGGFAGLVGIELLRSPPSEAFSGRLAVMHGRVRGARRAMARALLSEAPSPEALVLLLQLVGDDGESAEPAFSIHDEDWALTVVERFGAIGVVGLCALARRFPEPESFGWLRRLGDLVERGAIPRELAGPVRTLAAEQVTSEDTGRIDDALRVLALVGAPPELLARVLSVALEDDLGAPEARRLVVSWPDRSTDTRLASEMALALASRSWARLRSAAWMALERGAPAARVIAARVLEVAEHDAEAIDAAVECARRLRESGDLDDAWVRAALARPESPIFVVAARAWRRDATLRAPLERALSSKARDGASAVQAAIALLHSERPLSPRDRRLAAVLHVAGSRERAELVHAMCMHRAPMGVVGPHLEELLVSDDPSVSGALMGVAVWLTSPKARAFLRTVTPKIVDPELRADIEEILSGHDSCRALR